MLTLPLPFLQCQCREKSDSPNNSLVGAVPVALVRSPCNAPTQDCHIHPYKMGTRYYHVISGVNVNANRLWNMHCCSIRRSWSIRSWHFWSCVIGARIENYGLFGSAGCAAVSPCGRSREFGAWVLSPCDPAGWPRRPGSRGVSGACQLRRDRQW